MLLKFSKVLSDIADKVARYISIVYTTIVILVVTVEVVLRALGYSITWSEELARWLLIGICYLGASIALKHGYHVGITKFLDLMPYVLKFLIVFITYILTTIFLVYLLIYGYQAAMNSLYQTGSLIPFSMFYVKIHLSIGAFLMLCHMLYYFVGFIYYRDIDNFKLSRM